PGYDDLVPQARPLLSGAPLMVGPENHHLTVAQPTRPHSATEHAGGAGAGLVGRALGPYRIVRLLGEGGMGAVYEAFDERLHRSVAIKARAGPLVNNPEARARFLAEARAAARLNHPNAVTLHEPGEADGVYFLVMELVPGGSVQDRVRATGPLPWR